MDPGQISEALAPMSLDQTSLDELESKIDVDIGINDHGQQVLDKYLEWLHQQVVKDMFVREDSLVYAWIHSLRNRGFEDTIIYSSFKDWQKFVDQHDPSSRRRYLMVDDEICQTLEGKRHTPCQTQSHIHSSRSHMIDTNNHSTPSLKSTPPPTTEDRTKGVGRKRTGANDTPVIEKRAKSSHSPGQNLHSAKDIESMNEGGKLKFPKDHVPHPQETIPSTGSKASEQKYLSLRNRTIPISLSPEPCERESKVSSGKDSTRAKKTRPVKSKSDAKKKKSQSKQHYICKRCHQSGHQVQECPTNLDPTYDTPPAPDYRCNFCGKSGVHLGTLCPKNNLYWSLTTQRKNAAERLAKSSESRNDRRERSPIQPSPPIRQYSDNYRPGSSPRARDEITDRYRPSYRERSLSSPGDASPLYGARGRSSTPVPLVRSPSFRESPCLLVTPVRETRRGKKRRNRDNYRPSKSNPVDRRSRSPKPGVSHTVTLRKLNTEGRLSYDDDDLFMQNAQSMPFGVDETNHSGMPYSLFQEDVPMASPGARSLDAETDRPAAVEAQDFLHTLSAQMGDESDIEAVCDSQMELMLDEVIDDVTETGDPTLTVDENGNQYRLLTSPPYGEAAIRLFHGFAALIVNPRPRRTTAADMMGLLDDMVSDTQADAGEPMLVET